MASPDKNLRIVLARRPSGAATKEDFRLEERPVPTIDDGHVLVRNHYLSLDPYMRGRMSDAPSYAPPQKLDEVMIGGTAGEVVASKNPRFAVGDKVVGMLGWQLYGASDGRDLRKVDTRAIPLSAYLGAVGMPGVTAYYGLYEILRPRLSETIVVSAASGAVGSVVGQLAKRSGCRAVGIAGGKAKCDYVVGELGFDACVDYKAVDFAARLEAMTPAGIDGLFENVGGPVFEAALERMNPFGRIALCGLVAGANGRPIPLENVRILLTRRLTLRGFIVAEHMEIWPNAIATLAQAVATGALRYRESVAEGLERAPEAFLGMLEGRNFGKQLVKLS
jgi:NADPH-dependent curcumin reductase CurA